MWSVVDYLKDPYLVLKVQNHFGIYPNVDSFLSKGKKRGFRGLKREEESTCVKRPNSSGSSPEADSVYSSDSDSEKDSYSVQNHFWYYLFVLGTELGDEVFYASFIPFWFWNIDGAVGRRVVLVWTIVMYIGQGIKDILCWPRPSSPPVFRLQKKWSQEYGMPSTHAMVGVSIPFSVVVYTMFRYQYPVAVGIAIATMWCLVVSVSRLYLGMHTVLDVIAGLVLAVLLMFPLVPIVDALDSFLLTNKWSPIVLLSLSIGIIVFYPKSVVWTPTRGDTTMVVSVCAGVFIGSWTNYQLGQMSEPHASPPYQVIWPTYEMVGLSLLRAAIGFSCLMATKAICKSASYATICFLFQLNSEELKKTAHTTSNSAKNKVELCYKYITYVLLGFNMLYLLPSVFKLLRIERPTFYTEI